MAASNGNCFICGKTAGKTAIKDERAKRLGIFSRRSALTYEKMHVARRQASAGFSLKIKRFIAIYF